MHAHSQYSRLAKEIVRNIQNQALKAGDKLLSLRQFAEQNQVSLTTAKACYHYLEELGYAEAIPKKGYYVSVPLAQQNTIDYTQFVSQVERPLVVDDHFSFTANLFMEQTKGKRSYPLSSGQLGPTLVDHKNLITCFNRILRKSSFSSFLHGDPKGNPRFRKILGQYFSNKGFYLHENDLMVTNGCMDAISYALEATTQEGDVIAINSPCYNGWLQLLGLMNRKIIEIPSNEDGIDLEQLETWCKTKKVSACLFTSNHHNPTGHHFSVTQKQSLAILAEKYQVPIIEDDIYFDLTHSGPTPLPIKHWDKHGWVIWCNSFSKSISPGLRLGWCHAGRFYQDILKRRFIKTLGINQIIQLGISEYINTGLYEKHLRKINRTLKANVGEYQQFIRKHFPGETSISTPSGGLCLWISIPGLNSEALAKHCQKEHITIRPGTQFSYSPRYNDCFRINIGWLLDEKVKQQLIYISNYINTRS